MDRFYVIVLLVAFVFLILCLIGVGIMMQKQDEDKAFPMYASQCPDKWVVSDTSGCQVPASSGLNPPEYVTAISKTDYVEKFYPGSGITAEEKSVNNIEGKYLKFAANATTCDKHAWARDVGVRWDGVSNYNKCDL
jgi:uncharacterized SAM-binding protein YcdF (DUF218 family)